MPWIEKYRPNNKDTFVCRKNVLVSINRLINDFQNVIFCGPSGSGKTSAILIIANEIYGESVNEMSILINASIDNNISTIRKLVYGFTSFVSLSGSSNRKLVIIDEAEGLTKDSQVMISHVIEKTNVNFCFICNSVSSLLPGIVSRCAVVHFPPLEKTHAMQIINSIIHLEKVKISKMAKNSIFCLSKGDMRVVVNTLQTLKAIKGKSRIKSSDVCACFGHPMESVINRLHTKLMTNECKINDIKYIINKFHNSLHELVIGLSSIIINRIQTNKDQDKYINALLRIRDIDLALALSCSQEIQMYSLLVIYA